MNLSPSYKHKIDLKAQNQERIGMDKTIISSLVHQRLTPDGSDCCNAAANYSSEESEEKVAAYDAATSGLPVPHLRHGDNRRF